ncbi:MAG: hypothetical protein J5741_03340 [Bacteroidales bacterium]|nr:hypothetical protein [Bacteroidales bacterium]
MKKILLLLVCALGVSMMQPVQAQKPHSDLLNEIGVGAGPSSLCGGFLVGTVNFFNALGSSLSHQAYDIKYYGVYDLHYYRQVTHWCQVGVKVTAEGSRVTRFTDTLRTSVKSIDDYVVFTLMPSVRFTYLNRPWVRLYSGADLGLGYFYSNSQANSKDGDEGNSSNFFPAFNVTAFGVSVGKGFYGLFELNAGFESLIKVGIGARF